MKFKKHNFYHIKWLDHVSQDDTWLTDSDIDLEPVCINSVGYVVEDCKDSVTISLNASEMFKDPQTSCHMLILKCAIVYAEKMDLMVVPHE